MLTTFLNSLIGLFISEIDEKADMDSKARSLVLNLASFGVTLIVLAEGIWALFTERIVIAIPFLFLCFILSLSHLYLKKISGAKHHYLLLTLLLITFSVFILLGGNLGIGPVWAVFFPFYATALTGRKSGLNWALALGSFMLFHFLILQGLSPNLQQYPVGMIIFSTILFFLSVLTAFAFQFIRSEILLEKERIILDIQNKNKAQEDLLSRLSHQIRTPLSNITGIMDILESTPMSDEQKDYINTIHASANNLVSVVNNLVMSSKTSMHDTREMIGFNLYNTINSVLRLFTGEETNVKFNLVLGPDVPMQVMGNSIKLKQILLNIITSTLKQPKDGQRFITLDVRRKESSPGNIELIFRLASDFVYSFPIVEAHAGESFFNHQDLVKLNAGKIINLLDLGITQKMIEVDGHALNVIPASEITIFEFGASFKSMNGSTNIVVQPEKPQMASAILKPTVNLEKAHILLVEDNHSNQQIINLYIKNKVMRIDFAQNGKEALEKFGMVKYDLILMDIQMPIMDGIRATMKIRELEKSTNTRVPIIAVTANAFPEDKERCYLAGMDDYLSKPFQPEELLQKMKKHLSE